ncbi:MAG: hypothetical protein JXB48_13800 [Candidatus Latescibacteria bacterium]|nr:hypothetical protein [Candidatus Latescibacterota bacterium]
MKMYFLNSLSAELQTKWYDFWIRCDHAHAQQHTLYAEIEYAKGRLPIFMYGTQDETIVCVGIFSLSSVNILGHTIDALCLRGFAFDDLSLLPEMLERIIKYFESINVGIIRISPYWYFPEADQVINILHNAGYIPYIQNPVLMERIKGNSPDKELYTSLIDISKDDQDILYSFKRSIRAEIKKLGKYDITIKPIDNLHDANIFHKFYSEMCDNRNMIKPTIKEFKTMFENILVKGDIGILLGAYHNFKFLGGMWVLRNKNYTNAMRLVVCRDRITACASKNFGLTPCLHWNAIQWGKSKGCLYYDLEGDAREVKPSHPMHGIYTQKLLYNPIRKARINDHIYVCNEWINQFHEFQKMYYILKRKINKLHFLR